MPEMKLNFVCRKVNNCMRIKRPCGVKNVRPRVHSLPPSLLAFYLCQYLLYCGSAFLTEMEHIASSRDRLMLTSQFTGFRLPPWRTTISVGPRNALASFYRVHELADACNRECRCDWQENHLNKDSQSRKANSWSLDERILFNLSL